MQTGSGDFIFSTEYNLNMMENREITSPKKIKRFRSAFTTDQVNYLEKQFKKFPYIGNAHRKEVAITLNIPERAVKIWFQNRRMKEKKETTIKELDDEISHPKSLEFPKDQFNNVHKSSANDQQSFSLPILAEVNKANNDEIIVSKNNLSCTLSSGLLVKDSGFKTYDNGTHRTFDAEPGCFKRHHSISPKNYAKSAEFSIDLCKKYKTESNIKTKLVPAVAEHHQDIKPNIVQKTIPGKVMEQIIPEDLSSRKVNAPPASLPQTVASNNPGYISVVPTVSPFFTQQYYSAGGVLWKPVNVVPTITTSSSSVPVINNIGNVPTVQESTPTKCCRCDCHLKPGLLPYNYQQQSPAPQYIITALQFPSPSAQKF